MTVHGCPDASGCTLFTGGYYPNGICIGTGGCGGGIATRAKTPRSSIRDFTTSIMEYSYSPLYGSPRNRTGDGTGGTIFY